MLINSQISSRKIQKQYFGFNKPDFVATSAPDNSQKTNLNNTPTIQNKVIVQPYKPAYREIQTFEVPNVGKGHMYELKNGHKVVIIPKQGTTNIYTHVKVGFFDEPKRLAGVSHLLEHLMTPFSVALSGVKSNATTTSDLTYYNVSFVHENIKDLEEKIMAQSQIVQGPNFTNEDFAREKKIVVAEIAEHDKTSVHDTAYKTNYDNLFGKDKAARCFSDKVSATYSLTKQDLMEHYNRFYTPNNMVTTIVGEVDPDETIKIVSKYFNVPSRKKGKWDNDSYPDYSTIIQKTQRADFKNIDDSKETKTNICFVGPEGTSRNKTIAGILSSVITEQSPVSNLDKQFLYKPVVDFFPQRGHGTPPIIFDFGFTYEDNNQDEMKSIYAAIFDTVQTPIKNTDIEDVKKRLCKAIEDNENSEQLCKFIGECVARGDSPNIIQERVDMTKSITTEEVEDFKKKYIDLNKASVIVKHPKDTPMGVTFGKKPDNNVEQYLLPNNLIVVVDTTPGTSNTSVNLQILPAQGRELSKSSCVVYQDMLSNKKDNILKNTKGISIDPSVDFDGVILVSVDSQPENIVQGIKTAKNLLFTSQYSGEEFEKAKNERKAFVKMGDTPQTAQDVVADLFGNHSFEEVKENIDKTTLGDTRDFYNQIMSNAQARVVITMPKRDFQQYKNGILTELSQGFPKLQQKQQIVHSKMPKDIDKPYVVLETSSMNDNQAQIRQVSKIFHSENLKDQIAIDFLTKITNARILKDLRENQGISYTPSVYNYDNRFIFSVETNTAQSPENIKKIVDSIDRQKQDLMQNPISQEELSALKKDTKVRNKKFAEVSTARNKGLLTSLNTLYGTTYQDAEDIVVEEITLENIQRAAQLIFSAPSVTAVVAAASAIDANKEYLKSKGEIIEVPINH